MPTTYTDSDLNKAAKSARALKGRFRDNAFEALALIAAESDASSALSLLQEIPLQTRAMGYWRVAYEHKAFVNLPDTQEAVEHWVPWPLLDDEPEQPTPWTRNELSIALQTLNACAAADWGLARKLAGTVPNKRLQFALYVKIARSTLEFIDLQRMARVRRENNDLPLNVAHTFQAPSVEIKTRSEFMHVLIEDRLRHLTDRLSDKLRDPFALFQATRLLAVAGGVEHARATAEALILEAEDHDRMETAFAIGNALQGKLDEAREYAARVHFPLNRYLAYGHIYAAKHQHLS